MKKIRTAAALLLAAVLLPLMISCSKLPFLNRGKSDITKYVNEDYHFSLTYPSYFSTVKEIPSEENGDEYRIEISHNQTDLIYVDISYKKAADLYEFAELFGLEKEKIKPLSMKEFEKSTNSFSYDKRDCPDNEKPAYYIFASTKRMLYTVCYEYERGNKNADKVCDTLHFEFDVYANVPKENQFISPGYSINQNNASVSIPADYSVKLYPSPESVPVVTVDEESGEVIRPDYSAYKSIEAASVTGYFILSFEKDNALSLQQLTEDAADDVMKSSFADICGAELSDITFEEKGVYKAANSTTYRRIYFTCVYNGSQASGTFTAGYTAGSRYFNAIYLLSDDSSDAQRLCYDDMIHSMVLK